jgi:hypothetical protein
VFDKWCDTKTITNAPSHGKMIVMWNRRFLKSIKWNPTSSISSTHNFLWLWNYVGGGTAKENSICHSLTYNLMTFGSWRGDTLQSCPRPTILQSSPWPGLCGEHMKSQWILQKPTLSGSLGSQCPQTPSVKRASSHHHTQWMNEWMNEWRGRNRPLVADEPVEFEI